MEFILGLVQLAVVQLLFSNMITNEFLVKFALFSNQLNYDTIEKKTLFTVENAEDNILYFYYHVLDITKCLIDGTIKLYGIPEYSNSEFKNHVNSLYTKKLLESYMSHILNEIEAYETYKKLIIPPTEQ
jgi:hypothetical protein